MKVPAYSIVLVCCKLVFHFLLLEFIGVLRWSFLEKSNPVSWNLLLSLHLSCFRRLLSPVSALHCHSKIPFLDSPVLFACCVSVVLQPIVHYPGRSTSGAWLEIWIICCYFLLCTDHMANLLLQQVFVAAWINLSRKLIPAELWTVCKECWGFFLGALPLLFSGWSFCPAL